MSKELEIYYDHYKDTFVWMRGYIKSRDRYFIYLVILVGILSLNSSLPSLFNEITREVLAKNVGINNFSNFNIIDTLLLFIILIVAVKYYQVNLLIENQYKYLHHIETGLSDNLGKFKIEREGNSYLTDYPIFSSIIHRLYTVAFPLLLIIIIAVKWHSLCNHGDNIKLLLLNSLICFTTIILTIFYLTWINFRDFSGNSKKG